MVIQSYKVDTAAQRSYVKMESEKAQMTTWGGGVTTQVSMEKQAVYAEFSSIAQQMMLGEGEGGSENSAERAINQPASSATDRVGDIQQKLRDKYEMKLEMLRQFIYQLTGRRINVFGAEIGARRAPQLRIGNLSARGIQFGGEITHEKTTYESEAVSFSAKGVVKTADGKTIDIDMQLNMSRQFYENTRTSIGWGAPQQQGNLCDPLVINYGGTAASLTERKFSFDLDFDGNLDQISFAGPGSGFLAWDKNGDGKIGDGSELFGPSSGNGFGELSDHDSDGNGWIDENDEIFSQLKIWSKDEYSNDQLFTLKELGIGAIYLGDTETQFQMNDRSGNMQGQMRSTSFYLNENGSAGYVHHIDLLA
ncbi:hypothetical protein LJC49_00750 [Ruminococcaceae bacterium OttesenSCG-928-I18]|nr:hypothetical protein [Ruminococcaceae bacterium OttesenSCG-928-I18]